MPATASASASSTSLAITNPLVLYRALLSTSRIQTDPAQHRLALHLQTLYNRLKDYEPIAQYGHKLQQLQRTLGSTPANPAPGTGHDAPRQSVFGSIFTDKFRGGQSDSLALTKVLTSHEEAMRIDSPKGLLLHGEVGTGKSMLVDLFAECLPNRKKRRWHYNTFMLEVLAKLERLRKSREIIVPASLGQQDDYSLLWVARELISTSPILFIDEFQLPDRAAAKILTNLMTCFFQLGGVLVATSNRMPEELDKAAGVGFAPPPSTARFPKLGLRLGVSPLGKRSEFADFSDLLRARCDVWRIESSKDYRRSEAQQSRDSRTSAPMTGLASDFDGFESLAPGNMGLGWEQSTPSTDDKTHPSSDDDAVSSIVPSLYYVSQGQDAAQEAHKLFTSLGIRSETWCERRISVYGRSLRVPRASAGVAWFKFDELCSNALGPTTVLGPADYATLASHFHTFIVTDVPILSLLLKNEARRLITFLDSLYEAKCKLAIWAAAGPDHLFFPETLTRHSDGNGMASRQQSVDQDATYSETLSEIYQDTTAPFRPNIAAYIESDPGAASLEGADATHARFAGLFDEDRAEQQKELSRRHDSSAIDVGDARIVGHRAGKTDTTANMSADTESGSTSSTQSSLGPDFSRGMAFTGEDEKFAFKRARSRLWEICSARWWAREHDVSSGQDALREPSWWHPLSLETRLWERPTEDLNMNHTLHTTSSDDKSNQGTGPATSISPQHDPVLFQHGATSPFRTSTEPPPKISWTHAWGMMSWGKRAGRWGQGVEAFNSAEDRNLDEPANESGDEYVRRRHAWRQRDHPRGGRE